jgi:hypothetical protein
MLHERSGAMPATPRDDHGALTTATIFDDAVYCSEALRLPVNRNEDAVDEELALLATESGIQEPWKFLCAPHGISRALSTVTVDSDPRSSISVHSQETQSTSFTSAPSRTSKDQIHISERLPVMRTPPKLARASPTVDVQESPLEASPPGVQCRPSSSNLSVAQSVLSDSSASSTFVPRRKRATLLSLFSRKNSRYIHTTDAAVHLTNVACSSCTSQSHQGHQSRTRVPKLDCGHSLSPDAINVHIQEALQSGGQAVPSCCGIPLPRGILEVATATDEAELVAHRALPSPGGETIRDSGYCEGGVSAIELPRPLASDSESATAKSIPAVTSRRRHEAISIDSALAKEAFKSFQAQEKEQLERVLAFESNQRKALSAHHTSSLKRLAALQEASKDEKMQQVGPCIGCPSRVSLRTLQHERDMEHLDEVQILAELELREAHKVETQNVATALKHMEAYCLGSGQSHPDHPHVVTEEDFKKLDRQRMTQKGLPRRHENAINVLRAKQEVQKESRLSKQRAEVTLLDEAHEKERVAEEAEHAADMEKLEAIIQHRRKRLQQRWDLKFEMWRRDWETQHKSAIDFTLEHETWPLHTTTTMTPIPESSALAPYVQAAA